MPGDDPINPDQLVLRPFIADDDAEVISWFPDAGALRFFAGRRLSWPLDDRQWDGIRSDPAVSAWTAVLGEDPTPIGHGEIVHESDRVARFALLAIAPALRGRRLGTEVMRRLVQKARDSGYQLAYLLVHPDNASAIRGYRSLGFEPASETNSETNGEVDNGHGLRLELVLGTA